MVIQDSKTGINGSIGEKRPDKFLLGEEPKFF